jgi:N-methylhydantoinase B
VTPDAILFEVVRHRLWAINDEAATTIARISGSPVANESYDFNTALMDAEGNVVIIGAYVMAHACALDRVVRYVIEEHSENPGIGPGDMYLTNDPYVGAMHQPDVVLVAPIFLDGARIMWCGSVVHQPDVGGPLAGSVTTGARSIYEEAIPMPPVRIVEGGTLRKDLEREYLIRSRLPELNALDLRGQMAANRVQASRVVELCSRYGREKVLGAVANLVDSAERRFRARLRDLPDGRWRAVSLVEHDGVQDAVYEVALTMDKRGAELELDFTGSSEQAPALVNCSKGTLYGYVLAALLTLLAYDLPWSPAALLRAVIVRAREGSVVDARWPAGVSMGNTAVGHAIRTVVNICAVNMLDGSEAYERLVMASCMGSFAGQNISGVREDGTRFGTMLLDSLAGGGGARSFADGVDTAGVINSPKAAIGNVEVNEHNYPILYLWRRQTSDSGGPGRYRGGLGGEHAYVLHGATQMESTQFAHGAEQPTGLGVAGGEPGSLQRFVLVGGGRDLAARRLAELAGEVEVLAPKGTVELGPADVFVHFYGGGGGLGDPLDRPPGEVAADVEAGLVTGTAALSEYFVVLAPTGAVDVDATETVRAGERQRRLAGAAPAVRRDRQPRPDGEHPLQDGGPGARRLSRHIALSHGMCACRHCGREWGALGPQSKEGLLVEQIPVPERWPAASALSGAARFVIRRFRCPGCATQIETEVNLADAPFVTSFDA